MTLQHEVFVFRWPGVYGWISIEAVGPGDSVLLTREVADGDQVESQEQVQCSADQGLCERGRGREGARAAPTPSGGGDNRAERAATFPPPRQCRASLLLQSGLHLQRQGRANNS
jgi:predicted acyl esterase